MGAFNYSRRITSEYQFKIMILMKLIFTYHSEKKSHYAITCIRSLVETNRQVEYCTLDSFPSVLILQGYTIVSSNTRSKDLSIHGH